MALTKWSTAIDLANIAGTALDNLGVGQTTTGIADLDNTTARNIYAIFRIGLGSFNPSGTPSLTLRLFRKVSGVAPDRSVSVFGGESYFIPMLAEAGARVYDSQRIHLPGPFVFGVEIINNANVNLAASGNSIIPTVWDEDI
jgi:hypothetical protein